MESDPGHTCNLVLVITKRSGTRGMRLLKKLSSSSERRFGRYSGSSLSLGQGHSMNFQYETYNNFLMIRPGFTRLDSIAAPEFRRFVIDLAVEQDMQVIVDLANIEFMDSSGLGAVIGCYKATQSSGGLAICNVQDGVKEVFTLTHMDRIFDIHGDFDSYMDKQAA